MILLKRINLSSIWIVASLLAAVFLYIAYYNPYSLFYLEQIQLFRFKWDYFAEFLNKPGGFAEYCGAFVTQFFLYPLMGPAVITLIATAVYFVTAHIFKRFNISGLVWSFIPVMMIIALHQDYLYKSGYSIALLFSLLLIAACLSIKPATIRYIAGFTSFLILYPLTGIFSFLAPLLFLLYELFFSENKYRWGLTIGCLVSLFIVPYLYWRTVYYLPFSEVWLTPLNNINRASMVTLVLLLAYFPFFTVTGHTITIKLKQSLLDLNSGRKNIIAGIIILITASGLVRNYSYDSRTERILRIDHYIQQEDWGKALEQCSNYPEPNRMIVYFTNLSLLKSGHLCDRMFHYNQAGPSGLSLPWTPNNLIPFFGCEIFYHLGYFNEAYRWAYEAMEMNGQCPRLLKRLVMTSLINGDIALAGKYLNQLHQSLFYKKWAEHYQPLVNNPDLLKQDRDINQKRELLIENDFFAGSNNSQLELEQLLANHPHNKAAFEFYMAGLLLNKDVAAFAKEVGRLKDFGYKEIPLHFEEAILWYIGYSKQNIIPQGYNIRKSTLEKFKSYAYSFPGKSGSGLSSPKLLERDFGSTWWYYYHFVNNQ